MTGGVGDKAVVQRAHHGCFGQFGFIASARVFQPGTKDPAREVERFGVPHLLDSACT